LDRDKKSPPVEKSIGGCIRRGRRFEFTAFKNVVWSDGQSSAQIFFNIKSVLFAGVQQVFSFTLIRKYLQQLIINADKQGASKSREHITFISGRFSAFCYAVERHF